MQKEKLRKQNQEYNINYFINRSELVKNDPNLSTLLAPQGAVNISANNESGEQKNEILSQKMDI